MEGGDFPVEKGRINRQPWVALYLDREDIFYALPQPDQESRKVVRRNFPLAEQLHDDGMDRIAMTMWTIQLRSRIYRSISGCWIESTLVLSGLNPGFSSPYYCILLSMDFSIYPDFTQSSFRLPYFRLFLSSYMAWSALVIKISMLSSA